MTLNVPGGGRARLLGSLGAAALAIAIALAVACGGGGGGDAGGTSGAVEGKLSLGDSTELTSATIDAGGGVITVDRAGDPLDGLELTVPTGSYQDGRDFAVSFRPITGHSYDDRIKPISPLISVENGGDYADDVMSLKVPVEVPEGQFAMGFFYDEKTGVLEGMPLLAADAGSVTIGTRHFSSFFISMIAESVLSSLTIDSGFRPGVDDWQFENNGSYAAPPGHCAGQSIAAMWYYYERKLNGEPDLYGRYDNYLSEEEKTPALWEDDNLAYRLASTVQKDLNGKTLEVKLFRTIEGTDDTLQMLAFAYAMHVTQAPQFVGLTDTVNGDGHAIIGYKVEGGNIYVADPNYPGVKSAEGKIEYVDGAFKPYRSALSAKSDPTSFDKIGYYAVSALVDWEAVGARFAEMENGAVGNEYFPAYTMPGSSATTVGSALLVDGVAFPDDRLRVYPPDLGWTVKVFRGGEELPKVGGFVTLLPGENKLGILVELNGLYVDFYRVTVIYNQVTISPDPIIGNAGDDLAITATMPAQVTDARYEWDYGDGTPKENLTLKAMHVFAEEGEYPITVNVYDEKDRLIGSGKAVAKIGAGAATPTSQAGAGDWVLKLVQTDVDKSEEVFSFTGLACSGGGKATSTETGATIVTTGGCQAPGAVVANETAQHSWSRPPDRLTPGQELTVTMTATQSGLCAWQPAEPAEACRREANIRHGVVQGDGWPGGQEEFDYSDLIYDSSAVGQSANAWDRPTATAAWTVPDGTFSGKTLLVQFSGSSHGGRVRTNFWYEWQGP